MKSLRSRIVLLGAALVLSVVLGLVLLKPGSAAADSVPLPAGLIVLGVLTAGLVVWTRRRPAAGAGGEATILKCLERVRLQPGRDLHLVEVAGILMLVASSENGIRLLTRLDVDDGSGEEAT